MEIKHFLTALKRISLLLIIYSLCRVLFYIFNLSYFQDANIGNIILAFIFGIRYDLSIILWANVLFIALSIFPFPFLHKSNYQRFLKVLFFTVNIPLIILNLIDFEFFKFRGKRTSFDILNMSSDIQNQSVQLFFHYWYIILIAIALIYLMFKCYPKLSAKPSYQIKYVYSYLLLILLCPLMVFGMRGGYQLKPITPNHAFTLSPNVLGNLILNTPFTLLTTMGGEKVEKVNFFNNSAEVHKLIGKRNYDNVHEKKKSNVVILILESFASEYWGYGNNYRGYTPFLDSLSQNGWFFKNNFANGRTSQDAVPAILAGIPSLMNDSYITSVYQGNKITGLGSILSKHGYTTSFFHGARNGSMDFDVFVKNAGFEEYYGLNEYPESEKDFDGHWGIYDEPFLQFFNTKISEQTEPFISCLFTLSSHQPYSIQKKYKKVFPKGDLPIHESIGYTDNALRIFFNLAKKEKWYNNTLFIITADHTQMSSRPEFKNIIGRYNVPLLLFHPSDKELKADTSKITQHIDIIHSVVDYLNVEPESIALFGRSIFDSGDGLAINYSDNSYRIIHKDYFLDYNVSKGGKLFDFTNDKSEKKPIKKLPGIKEQYELEMKAYIQYFNNGINENNW